MTPSPKKKESTTDFDYMKNGVPHCVLCGEPFVHAIDSITGRLSNYLWKAPCGHGKLDNGLDLVLSVG